MAEKDNSKHSHVTVSGQYQAEISNAGFTHRIYRYRVNIFDPGMDQPCSYDRDLHICEQRTDTPEPVIRATIEAQGQATTRPAAETIPVAPEQVDAVKNGLPVIEPDAKPIKAKTQTVPDDTPLPPVTETDAATNTRIAETPAPPGKNHRATGSALSSVKRVLIYLTDGSIKTLHAVYKLLPGIRKRGVLPERKMPATHKRFTTTTRYYLSRGALLSSGILFIIALMYFLPVATDRITTLIPQVGTRSPVKQNHQPDNYHAVIEKNLDGVVITIQGPEHEAVLTKLPPGYQPIVQDNKIVHIVTRGNTLWFIAKRYIKDPYRYPELAHLNKIKNPDLIYPGDKVIIQHIRKPGP